MFKPRSRVPSGTAVETSAALSIDSGPASSSLTVAAPIPSVAGIVRWTTKSFGSPGLRPSSSGRANHAWTVTVRVSVVVGGGAVVVAEPDVSPVVAGADPDPVPVSEGTGPADCGSSAPQLAARTPSEPAATTTAAMKTRRIPIWTPSVRVTGLILDTPRNSGPTAA